MEYQWNITWNFHVTKKTWTVSCRWQCPGFDIWPLSKVIGLGVQTFP